LLGRPYTLSGTVVTGKQLGRTLGFPTANLSPAPNILVPAEGIYAAYATLTETSEHFRAAVSIGTNPTISPQSSVRTVEAYLMDGFSRDIYGKSLELAFHSRLRGTVKFDSLDALIQQMHRDVAESERLLTAS
jgi:riboflavin kinase / FMN adenylyltransferase